MTITPCRSGAPVALSTVSRAARLCSRLGPFAAAALVWPGYISAAQETGGAISGTIVDQQKAAAPGTGWIRCGSRRSRRRQGTLPPRCSSGYPAETGTNPSSLAINPQLNYRSNYYGLFVQDDLAPGAAGDAEPGTAVGAESPDQVDVLTF